MNLIRSAAEAITDTEIITEAEIEAARIEAQGKCEFCPDKPGVRCCVCAIDEAAHTEIDRPESAA